MEDVKQSDSRIDKPRDDGLGLDSLSEAEARLRVVKRGMVDSSKYKAGVLTLHPAIFHIHASP
jgi:hypothetical protein